MIRLGMVGLGRWGQVLFESLQNRSDQARFVAAATGTPAKAADYAARWGIELAPSYEALIARPDIDGVVLATPHAQHLPQMLAAFDAGKHVFVEKPVTLRLDEAKQAVAAARQAGRVLAAGFNRRFLPATRHMKQLLDDGALGRLLMAEANFSMAAGYRYSAEMWRADPHESPAGGMTGLGIHLVDLLIHLAGPVAQVATRAHRGLLPVPLDDTVTVALDFASGALGNLTTVIATADLWHLRLLCSEGWIEMRGEDELLIARRGIPERKTLHFPRHDCERAELDAFVAAITGRKDYPVPLDEVLHGVGVFQAIVDSRSGNATVPLAEPDKISM